MRQKGQKQFRITVEDYIKANRKASREEEIQAHGKQVSMRHSVHRSLKEYNRKKQGKRVSTDEL